MGDILIRNVPDDVVAAIDQRAQQAGLSRSEYLRRTLAQERAPVSGGLRVEDLTAFARRFRDLEDEQVLSQAWT